jgi:hypothetical protein
MPALRDVALILAVLAVFSVAAFVTRVVRIEAEKTDRHAVKGHDDD